MMVVPHYSQSQPHETPVLLALATMEQAKRRPMQNRKDGMGWTETELTSGDKTLLSDPLSMIF